MIPTYPYEIPTGKEGSKSLPKTSPHLADRAFHRARCCGDNQALCFDHFVEASAMDPWKLWSPVFLERLHQDMLILYVFTKWWQYQYLVLSQWKREKYRNMVACGIFAMLQFRIDIKSCEHMSAKALISFLRMYFAMRKITSVLAPKPKSISAASLPESSLDVWENLPSKQRLTVI